MSHHLPCQKCGGDHPTKHCKPGISGPESPDVEAIRSDEAVRDAFADCYTLQGIVHDNGMNVECDQLVEWDRVESVLIRAILAYVARWDASKEPSE